jgi:hypothetical protein
MGRERFGISLEHHQPPLEDKARSQLASTLR